MFERRLVFSMLSMSGVFAVMAGGQVMGFARRFFVRRAGAGRLRRPEEEGGGEKDSNA